MRIGFDGKRATQNFTGLGNYSRYILHVLSTYFPENVYQLFSHKKAKRIGLIDLNIELIQPDKRISNIGWRSFGLVRDLKKNQIDLYHGLSNEIPFGIKRALIPSIVTIHDLIFLRYPQYYSFIDRIIYQYKFKHACKNADKIIAVSEQTKKDIISFFGTDPHKIAVVYQNCSSEFMKSDSSRKHEIAAKYHIPKRFVLSVGSIEERKNILVVVKALKNINSEIHLVIVGKETHYTKKVKKYIEDNGLKSRVHILKNVPFSDLPTIYQLAEIFIYPSLFEGFGIPILEALHSGIPVIAATGSCLEEAGGSSSIYIKPQDIGGFAEAIEKVSTDAELRLKMIQEGYKYVKKFDDYLIAKQLFELYKETVK